MYTQRIRDFGESKLTAHSAVGVGGAVPVTEPHDRPPLEGLDHATDLVHAR